MLALEMEHDEFTRSNGWLSRWQIRYNVKLAVLCGEAAEVPQAAVDDWTKRLPALLDGYCHKDRPCLMATVTRIGPA